MIVPLDCPHCGEAIRVEAKDEKPSADCPKCTKTVPLDNISIGPGVVIGKGYRIDSKLAEDSQVQIFIATQESMDRKVAIKIVPPEIAMDEEKLQRFQREVKLAATLQHPNILTAYGAGKDNGIHFLIKQYVPGEVLEQICVEKGTVNESAALKYIIPIAEALRYAWDEQKIIHRNVKPENILISDSGKSMLMDLGIAKSMEPDSMSVTSAGFTVGTPEYMSPEQVRASTDLDFRSDMYCLGITLYRMVTGGVPFADASAMAVMQKQLKEVAIPAQFKNSDVSTNCSGVIDKLLSKNREDRYESWADLIGDMKAVLKGQKPRHAKNVASQPETEMAKDRPDKRKRTAQKIGGKKKRTPRAKGVTREDVERIANEMYGGGYMVKKLILYGVSALIPLLLVGGFFYLYNQKFKKTKQIEQLYRNAETIFRTETNSFDKAIGKFDEVRRLTDPGSAMYQKAEARIHELQIEKVLFSLKEKSAALIKRGRWRDAVRLYEDYSGEYSGETADQRKRQAAMLRKRNR